MSRQDDGARRALAAAVRAACLEAARAGYEQAAIAGLCHEGAVEASLDAIRMLDIDVLAAATPPEPVKKP
ncbi:MAG TPA: acetyltransferase [Gammaproteobacteria bacterium]|nr:acetyltransferase [Gammaproteobacteria bacterium]